MKQTQKGKLTEPTTNNKKLREEAEVLKSDLAYMKDSYNVEQSVMKSLRSRWRTPRRS